MERNYQAMGQKINIRNKDFYRISNINEGLNSQQIIVVIYYIITKPNRNRRMPLIVIGFE